MDLILLVVRSTFKSRKRITLSNWCTAFSYCCAQSHVRCLVTAMNIKDFWQNTTLWLDKTETDVQKLKVKLPKQELLFNSALWENVLICKSSPPLYDWIEAEPISTVPIPQSGTIWCWSLAYILYSGCRFFFFLLKRPDRIPPPRPKRFE